MRILLLAWMAAAAAAQTIGPGSGSFEFMDEKGNAGRPITVWYHQPAKLPDAAPIVFVMHGMNRDGDRYRDEWREHAERRGFLLLCPSFPREHYPRSSDYNGGMLFDEAGALNPEEKWTFSAVEHLFDYVKKITGRRNKGYRLYGHSAGAQFVHRFVWMKPDARYEVAVAANAGSYCFPDTAVRMPYGLGGTPAGAWMKRPLERKVVILLGGADTDPRDSSLDRGAEAMKQGRFRFERGKNFFAACRAKAAALGAKFGWRMEVVPGVGHSNAGMAAAAAPLLAE
jgi:poly(3-hydroxybutyrate) depolymerase